MPSVKAKDIVPEFVSDDVDVMMLSGLNYGHSCFYPTLKYCQEILHINVWLILLPNSYHSSHIKTLICKEILIDIMKKTLIFLLKYGHHITWTQKFAAMIMMFFMQGFRTLL